MKGGGQQGDLSLRRETVTCILSRGNDQTVMINRDKEEDKKMKRTQLILLFMLVFCGAVLLSDIPAGAQNTTNITGVSIDGGRIQTSFSGQAPVDPCYNENPADPASPCLPMYPVAELWICDGVPALSLDNCRKFNYSTVGASYNTWVYLYGRWRWVAP